MISRQLQQVITDKLFKNKALIILGPRQVGKSTLLEILQSQLKQDVLLLNCDNNEIKKDLTNPSLNNLKRLIGNNKIIFIDEAQRVKNIGMTLKLFTDQMADIQLIVTGSSSLELSNEINEPLTGRKLEYQLFPLSISELINHFGFIQERANLETRLIFGMYPDIINNPGSEREYLQNLVSSYLYKDVFIYQDIRKPDLIEKLLEALALQVGSEVFFSELASTTGTDSHTVQRYISLLEKAFIVFRLRSFSRNVRSELKKSRKIYFYDNGVRNAIMGNFSSISSRTDSGALWENFLISERMKYLHYNKTYAKRYFWRTRQQQEIDYIEEFDGRIDAYEIKWNPGKKVTFPRNFKSNYPEANLFVLNQDNFWEFLGE